MVINYIPTYYCFDEGLLLGCLSPFDSYFMVHIQYMYNNLIRHQSVHVSVFCDNQVQYSYSIHSNTLSHCVVCTNKE
jgi:hypothetical protein